MPPSELVDCRLMTPSTMAWTLLHMGLRMWVPWGARPPERGAPQESMNEYGLDTGQDTNRPLTRWVVLNPASLSATCLAFSKSRLSLATLFFDSASMRARCV